MRRWEPLKEHQLALLRRIGEGDDLSAASAVAARGPARHLEGRGLVSVSRRGDVWRAVITDAGRYYLDHGDYQDLPLTVRPLPRRMRAPQPAPAVSEVEATRASVAAPKPLVARPVQPKAAADLIAEIQKVGGELQVENPDEETRARYRRAVHAAKQYQLVPEGYHLRHTGRDAGDMVFVLSHDQEPNDTGWNRIRLNKRRVTTVPELVMAALEKDTEACVRVTTDLPRALALVRQLGEVAAKRGYKIGVNTKTKHPRVYLAVKDTKYYILLTEEYDEKPHQLTDAEKRLLKRNPWATVPKTDRIPSGRLRLRLPRYLDSPSPSDSSWVDERRTLLEKRLNRVMDDVEAQIAADEERHRQWLHEKAEVEAARERAEAAKRRQWEQALAEARPQAQEAIRRRRFRAVYDAWVAAEQLRAFCDAMTEGATTDDAAAMPAQLESWIAWGRAHAERLYLSVGPPPLAAIDFEPEPGPKDLRPYMGEWSPTEPRHEYRSSDVTESISVLRSQASQWYHGMIGKPSWWRHSG